MVERFANDVVDRAFHEGWLLYPMTPVRHLNNSRSMLARNLRQVHLDGDGRPDEDEE